jgi:hypothetical protein
MSWVYGLKEFSVFGVGLVEDLEDEDSNSVYECDEEYALGCIVAVGINVDSE